ncbi:MAG: hypothetical protein GY753_01795 [Gammaproteobacteria bacterium]|nr:hypothetical protein [Gammaproteobacteria bacterium]
MIEFIFIIFGVLWVSLYYIENAGTEHSQILRYVWLVHVCRPILFFSGIGLFIIFIGTDWQSPFWELIAGLIFILIGIFFGVQSVLHRKEIEEKIKKDDISSGVEE